MSNVYLKVTLQKNLLLENLNSISLKDLSSGQFLVRSN